MNQASVEDWERWEAECSAQARVDRIRVRGYALATFARVDKAKEELERQITLMLRARAEAERALAALCTALDHAEELARVVARDDDDENERLARALEHLEDIT